MSSRFLRYERIAVDTVNRMRELIDKADTFPSILEYPLEAAMIGCNALQRFTVDTDFYDDLFAPYRELDAASTRHPLLSSLKRLNPAGEWEKLRGDMNEFNRFLTIEREVLVKGGMEPGAADILIFHCREITARRVSQDEAQEALASLQIAACGEVDTLRQNIYMAGQLIVNDKRHRRTMRILRRVLLGVGAVAMVGLNGGAIAATVGLSSLGLGLSVTIGVGIIQHFADDVAD